MIRAVADNPFLIGVSGQIAAGKSTLVRNLAPLLGLQPVPEPDAANPYLERYYRDPGRWAFQNLLFFFEQSVLDQVQAQQSPVGVIQERLPQEHIEVFGRKFNADGFVADDELALVDRLWALIARVVQSPTLLIYLEVDPDTAFSRIKARTHIGDDGLTLPYLRDLGRRYDSFIRSWKLCPVIRLDSRVIDVQEPDDVEQVAAIVLQHLPPVKAASLARSATSRAR